MTYFGKNRELIDKLHGKFTLTSSRIERMEAYSMDGLAAIDVHIQLLYAKDNKKLLLRFFDVRSFGFYHRGSRPFENVEILKFFSTEAGTIYISFDPIDENEAIGERDNDFIEANTVEGYLV